MEIELSDAISFFAILVSVGTVIYQMINDRKLNAINLEAEYFKEIYGKYLLYEIPNARKRLQFINKTLSGQKNLMGILNEIRHDSIYFLYTDKKFYENIKFLTQDLEDYLANCANISFSLENQEVVFNEIQEKLENIYDTLIKKYHGRK